MSVEFLETSTGAIREEIVSHLGLLPCRVDSFMEEHITSATPWRISIDGIDAGYLSVRNGETLTQFTLRNHAARHGQVIFLAAQKQCGFMRAMASTVDHVFLAHAMDRQQSITVQAFQFALGPRPTAFDGPELHLRPATPADQDAISRHSSDFFAPIDHWIASGSLLIGRRNGELVGFRG